MRHLLDAHTLIWALDDPSRLGASARAILQNPAIELTVSVGTIWELSIKTSLEKLSLSLPYRQWVERALAASGDRMSKRSRHRVSGGQDARNERPATEDA